MDTGKCIIRLKNHNHAWLYAIGFIYTRRLSVARGTVFTWCVSVCSHSSSFHFMNFYHLEFSVQLVETVCQPIFMDAMRYAYFVCPPTVIQCCFRVCLCTSHSKFEFVLSPHTQKNRFSALFSIPITATTTNNAIHFSFRFMLSFHILALSCVIWFRRNNRHFLFIHRDWYSQNKDANVSIECEFQF